MSDTTVEIGKVERNHRINAKRTIKQKNRIDLSQSLQRMHRRDYRDQVYNYGIPRYRTKDDDIGISNIDSSDNQQVLEAGSAPQLKNNFVSRAVQDLGLGFATVAFLTVALSMTSIPNEGAVGLKIILLTIIGSAVFGRIARTPTKAKKLPRIFYYVKAIQDFAYILAMCSVSIFAISLALLDDRHDLKLAGLIGSFGFILVYRKARTVANRIKSQKII